MPIVAVPEPAPSRMRIAGGMADAAPHAARSFAFGEFVLKPERQLLLRNAAPVRVGGRALDILTALVERPGEIVNKQDLVARAWPDTFVDEANLKVNMAGLRRALGEDRTTPQYIATVVGRGYRFIASVRSPASGTALPAGRAVTTAAQIAGLLEALDGVRRELQQLAASHP